MSDFKLNPLLAFLTRTLLRPRVLYQDPSRKGEILSEPSILISNHTCHMDGPILNTVLQPQKIHSLAAKDRFDQPSFGFFLRHSGCIPIDREHADTSWLHDSLEVLRVKKEHIAIYPEGRHGEHRKQRPFHPGAIILAAMAQVPIVLVYQDGPARWLHRNGLILSAPFRLPAPEGRVSSQYITEQTQMLEEKMKELMNEYISRTEG